MTWIATLSAVFGLLAAAPAAPDGPVAVRGRCRDGRVWSTSLRDQTLMLGLLNEVRADAARPPLVRHAVLDRMAMAHAADMACRDYFNHRNPERQKLPERLARANDGTFGRWQHLAEVIGTSDAANRQLERWLGSRSHRRAVLEEDHDRVGVGLVRIDGSTWDSYWVVEFAALTPDTRRDDPEARSGH
jgi:uncharacterized protein YkwD